MFKGIDILVKSKINYDNGLKEITKNKYNGALYIKDNGNFLRYKENLNQEMGNTWTILRWNLHPPYKIILVRQGNINMKQIFIEGSKYFSKYNGTYGTLDIETVTNKIILNKNEKNGKIYLDYDMKLNNLISGNYILEIDYFT